MSTYFASDDYMAKKAAEHPAHFEWVASIHPYDPRALDRLDAAVARGARAIKWLPTAQNIDPASPRCDRFYARLVALKLPLITHAGDEQAVVGFGEHLGNPLRLRRPLDAGVRVVVAHCASLGHGEELDAARSATSRPTSSFSPADGRAAIPRPAVRRHLRHDAGQPHGRARHAAGAARLAVAAAQRLGLPAARRGAADRPAQAGGSGLLDAGMVEPLRALRHSNVLLFDFVLKRSLSSKGQRFANGVFETAPFFAR